MISEPSYYVGRPVESMQTMLRFAAEGNNRLLPVVPDGVFGPNTMAAVTAFQRYYGLPATGVMNGATWERLVQTYQAQLVQQAPAEAMQPILNPQQTMKPGESNYHIYLVQAALRVLSSVYRGLPQTPVSGTLDASTVTAVRRFQALCGLPVTGEVDRHTWRYLCAITPWPPETEPGAAGEGNNKPHVHAGYFSRTAAKARARQRPAFPRGKAPKEVRRTRNGDIRRTDQEMPLSGIILTPLLTRGGGRW